MAGIVTEAGRMYIASGLVGALDGSGDILVLHLFKSDSTPTTGSVPGDFTEAAFGSYTAIQKYLNENSGPVLTAGEALVLFGGGPQHWDCTSGTETIYGWYITEYATGYLLFAERYDVPHDVEEGTRHTLFCKIGVGICG